MSQVNHLKEKADEYLRKHRINELFEDICTAICFKQPEDIEGFIIQQLKLKKEQGFKTGIFSDEEIDNVFTLFDLKKDGFIGKEACKDALKTLASSEYQFNEIDEQNIPEKVDAATFTRLCYSVLGVQKQ
ncbi:hypothetical protein ABPG72_022050 [Tetrahymena utriculariae]